MTAFKLTVSLLLVALALADGRAEERPSVDRFGDPLPAGVSMRLGTVRFRSGSWSMLSGFSADGKTLTAACMPHDAYSVYVWDAASGEQVFEKHTGQSFLNSLSRGPDGWFGVSARQGLLDVNHQPYAELRLWNLESPAQRIVAESREGSVFRSALCGDKAVGCYSIGTRARVFRLPDAETIAETKFAAANTIVTLSPDGGMVAASGDDNVVRVWSHAHAEKPRDLLTAPERIASLGFTPDGGALLVGLEGDGEKAVLVVDAATGKILREFTLPAGEHNVYGCRLAPDGSRVAAIDGASGRGVLWDARSGDQIGELDGFYAIAGSACFSPDSRTLAVVGFGSVQRFDATTGKRLGDDSDGAFTFTDLLAVSPDSRLVAAGGINGAIHLWDLSEGKSRHVFWHGHDVTPRPREQRIRGLAFSPDSKRLASSGLDETVRVWDVESGKAIHRLQGHPSGSYLQGLAFASAGEVLRSWGGESTLRAWRMTDGEQTLDATLRPEEPMPARGPKDEPPAAWEPNLSKTALSPDGSRLVLAAHETGYVFDGETGALTSRFPGLGEAYASSLDVSSDNDFAVMSISAGETPLPPTQFFVRGVRLAEGELRYEVAVLGTSPGPIALTADSSRFAVTGTKAPIQIHNAATGEIVRTIERPGGYIHSLAFTPNGLRLIAGMSDTTLLVWDLADSE